MTPASPSSARSTTTGPKPTQPTPADSEYIFGAQMIVAPIVAPADKISGLAKQTVWIPKGEWIEWPSGRHFTGPTTVDRDFSIYQIPIYVKSGAIIPMQPPMLHTGEKPVDPLIVNVWPLAPGESASYSLYEDSGASVDYQRGVFAHTPIKAIQAGDTLTVEIGPAAGSYPGMLTARAFELRLPADWPPESITVNGSAVKQADALGKNGWSFDGNTLTTIVPIASTSVTGKVTIEVRRAAGLTARRSELDGFAGTMTRLRQAYEAMNHTMPAGSPPDPLIDAMQTGNRLSYHPETITTELAHLREVLPNAQAAVAAVSQGFTQRMDDYTAQHSNDAFRVANPEVEKQTRLDALARAQRLLSDLGSKPSK